jgi:hypothetical protein
MSARSRTAGRAPGRPAPPQGTAVTDDDVEPAVISSPSPSSSSSTVRCVQGGSMSISRMPVQPVAQLDEIPLERGQVGTHRASAGAKARASSAAAAARPTAAR